MYCSIFTPRFLVIFTEILEVLNWEQDELFDWIAAGIQLDAENAVILFNNGKLYLNSIFI